MRRERYSGANAARMRPAEQIQDQQDTSEPASERANRVAGLIVFSLPALAAFGPFIPGLGSMFAFRLASVLLLLIAAFGFRATSRSPLRRATGLLAFVWASASLLTLTFIGPAPQSWSELLSLGTGLCLVIAVTLLHAPRLMLTALLWGWLAAHVVISGLAVVEVASGASISAANSVERTIDGWGVTVTFFNPNNYATFLLYSFLAIFALWGQSSRPSAKFLSLLALASIPVLMTFTNSRTGLWLLALFIAVSILLFLRTRALLRLALVAATIVAALVMLENMDETPFEELASYIGNAGYHIEIFGNSLPVDSSTYVRWELVLAGFALFALYPLFGAGPGSFEGFVASTGLDGRTIGIISPHNGFMEILSQYGIFVFVIFIAWLGRMLVLGVRSRRRPGRAPASEGIVLILGIASLPVVLTMHSSALEPSTSWLFFAFLLLIARSVETKQSGTLLAVASPGERSWSEAEHPGVSTRSSARDREPSR
jgi:putative inorganic carbon (HCO3(-)) transporter